MKKLFVSLILPALAAGCLTTATPEIAEWTIPTETPALGIPVPESRLKAEFGLARFSQLLVRAPYDLRAIQVLRKDGTLAADPYNHFAASPSQLLKGPIQDTLARSPRFTTVVSSSSATSVSHVIEVTVTNLRLDCSQEDSVQAEVGLSLLVLDRDRQIVWSGVGAARVDATDGNYARAFTDALGKSLHAALGER